MLKPIGSALALAMLAGTAAAQDIQTWRITFDITDGALAGQQFFGELSYDQADLDANFTDGVLFAADGQFTFSVTVPGGAVLDLTDDPGALAFFGGGELIGLNYFGDNFVEALNTFDAADFIDNRFNVFVDPDFLPDGSGTFTFERLTETDLVTRSYRFDNTVIDDTDILNTPGDGDEDDENTNFNGENSVSVDADDGPDSLNPRQVLIRFNDIIGNGPNQVPPGAQIIGAVFRVEIDSPGSGFTAHRLLQDWDVNTVTWNTWGDNGTDGFDDNGIGGVQADNVEAQVVPDFEQLGVGGTVLSIDLSSSLQAFAAGEPNYGFALLPLSEGTDGVDFFTSEAPLGIPADFFPPLLTVELGDGRTLTFQEGQSGYNGTADTTLSEEFPTFPFGSLDTTSIDLSDGGFVGQYLLRFDEVFGPGANQIDPNSDTIVSASVRVRSTSPGEDVSVYELAQSFDEATETWNSIGGGVSPDVVFEPFDDVDTAGFSANGMTVENPGLTEIVFDTTDPDNPVPTGIGIGVEDRFDGDPETDSGFLKVTRDTDGPFAVRSLQPSLAEYRNFDAIEFYLRDINDTDALEIRVGVGNDANFWVSNDGFVPGDDWARARVDLTDAGQWTQVIGTGSFADAIANADRLQLRHETLPIADGQSADSASGDIGIDRITFANSSTQVRALTADFINTRFEVNNPAYTEDLVEMENLIDFDLTASFQRFLGDPASNLGFAFIPESTNGFDFDAEGNLQVPIGPQLFVSYRVTGGCNPADIADPFGVVDLADTDAFITGFLAGDSVADLAPPFGVIDLADVDLFIASFLGGCP